MPALVVACSFGLKRYLPELVLASKALRDLELKRLVFAWVLCAECLGG